MNLIHRMLLRNLSWRRRHLKLLGSTIRLAPPTAAIRSRLSVEHHLGVLANPVPRSSRDLMAVLELVLFLGRPGKVVTTDFDVVVGEFTELVIVHAEQFGFFGGTQVKTRDGVDDEGDDGGDDERVRAGGNDIGDLDVELFVVVDDPATIPRAGVDAVEADDRVVCEEGVEDEADDTCDTVFGEDIHRVIDADPVFDCFRQFVFESSLSKKWTYPW